MLVLLNVLQANLNLSNVDIQKSYFFMCVFHNISVSCLVSTLATQHVFCYRITLTVKIRQIRLVSGM